MRPFPVAFEWVMKIKLLTLPVMLFEFGLSYLSLWPVFGWCYFLPPILMGFTLSVFSLSGCPRAKKGGIKTTPTKEDKEDSELLKFVPRRKIFAILYYCIVSVLEQCCSWTFNTFMGLINISHIKIISGHRLFNWHSFHCSALQLNVVQKAFSNRTWLFQYHNSEYTWFTPKLFCIYNTNLYGNWDV